MNPRAQCTLVGLALALTLAVALRAQEFPPEVAPILQQNCVVCHSVANPQGKLVLESMETLERGGAGGTALVPGDSAASSLYQRLVTDDRTLRMPFGGKALAPELIASIRSWIDQMERSASGASYTASDVDFHRDIEPIFRENCYSCHAGKTPQSQLRLDTGRAALRGGLSGKVIVPGDAKGSRLIHRVKGLGGEQQMPLRMEPLSASKIALLEAWIDGGAVWPGAEEGDDEELEVHWSYKAPKRPQAPAVGDAGWVLTEIDRFILARLEKEGLQPSERADKETLIRRLSLDLTGLPPTIAEVDAFLADTRPDANERLVDRLLASPHYGERWARPWLDWARYADSHGFEKDLPRVMWKYRDWVIDALNQNMPFDQFTIEQVAGDMLPNATESQRIATGFNRNTMFNEEGGVDGDEAQHDVYVDRVNTTTTLWLGSTVACAQCHNHKFDPFTQKEYYQFYAFFANAEVTERRYGDTSRKWLEPTLELPTEQQAEQQARLQEDIERLEEIIRTETPELREARQQWEKQQQEALSRWITLKPASVESLSGSTMETTAEGVVLVSGDNPKSDTYLVEGSFQQGANHARQINAVMLEVLPDASLPRGGPGRDLYGNFVLSDFTIEYSDPRHSRVWNSFDWNYALSDDGRIGDFFQKPDPNKPDQEPRERKDDQLWTVDASREDDRVSRRLILPLDRPIDLPEGGSLRATLLFASKFGRQGIGKFRIAFARTDDPEFITRLPAKRRPFLAIAESERDPEQQRQLLDSFRDATPILQDERDQLSEARKAVRELGIATAMVLADKPSFERPSAPMRIRGSFLSPGEMVFADVPKVLPPLPPDTMPNRLGLARWLVSRDNPLTARVMVNRIWETYFGTGLVETSEDFGTQGALPSHPQLLDWLAVEFMDSGWDLKHLHKLIVMSATYQQQSATTPALQEADPYNRLLARGPRFRMEAEMIRDVTLAASGLLSPKIGGPSVFPYQPDGIWDVPYSSAKWEQSEGEDQFRRGLYTFLRRSSPYPSMTTFDAPSREVCTIRRVRTNTPLQALNALNDPVFFDAARALARRTLSEAPADERSRARYAFRLVTAREAPELQLQQILDWHSHERQQLAANPANAARIVGHEGSDSQPVTDLAAWTLVSHVLLNMDETLTKE